VPVVVPVLVPMLVAEPPLLLAAVETPVEFPHAAVRPIEQSTARIFTAVSKENKGPS
jgi:hypothetical protein